LKSHGGFLVTKNHLVKQIQMGFITRKVLILFPIVCTCALAIGEETKQEMENRIERERFVQAVPDDYICTI
jgi:hypothetical protein